MKRKVSAAGARGFWGRNHEGHHVNPSRLGPTVAAADLGRTRSKLVSKITKAGTATAPCWCERHYVTVTLDEVRSGLTHSCGRSRCCAAAGAP